MEEDKAGWNHAADRDEVVRDQIVWVDPIQWDQPSTSFAHSADNGNLINVVCPGSSRRARNAGT